MMAKDIESRMRLGKVTHSLRFSGMFEDFRCIERGSSSGPLDPPVKPAAFEEQFASRESFIEKWWAYHDALEAFLEKKRKKGGKVKLPSFRLFREIHRKNNDAYIRKFRELYYDDTELIDLENFEQREKQYVIEKRQYENEQEERRNRVHEMAGQQLELLPDHGE
jgi:hypothetical protein